MYIEIGVWGKNEKERHPKMPPFLCLLFKHLSGACQEPFGVNSIVGYHWLEPRYLKPPPIQVFPICDKVAPVYLVQSTIGVHATNTFHGDYRVKSAIKSLHDLLAYRSVHCGSILVMAVRSLLRYHFSLWSTFAPIALLALYHDGQTRERSDPA